jgi:hypothetical protein
MAAFVDHIRFASDATLAGLWGGGLLLFALFALWRDVRRDRRKQIDAVGWMPWTGLFLTCAFVGFSLLLLALKGWLGG